MADRIIVLAAPAKIKLELKIDRETLDGATLGHMRDRVASELSEPTNVNTDEPV
jgi:hypothetical protein